MDGVRHPRVRMERGEPVLHMQALGLNSWLAHVDTRRPRVECAGLHFIL